MPKNRSYAGPVVTAILAVLVVFIALPQSWKGWAPGFLQSPRLHLGLDLAGGTQLDFRISEEEIRSELAELDAKIQAAEQGGSPDALNELRLQRQSVLDQRGNIVEAIRTVLERRINSLGVSEATITPSYVGDEKHLLVECPGVVDVQKCIAVVGKTIQLEFKEQFDGTDTDTEKTVRAKADLVQRRLTESGSTLEKEGQDVGSDLGMSYIDSELVFQDQLPEGLEDLWNAKPGAVIRKEGSINCQNPSLVTVSFLQQNCVDAQGQLAAKEVPGVFLTAVLKPLTSTGRVIDEAPRAFEQLAKTESGATYAHREDLLLDATVDTRVSSAFRQMKAGDLRAVALGDSARVLFLRGLVPGGEKIETSHILVSYKGASAAEAGVTRTKEEALARAKQLKTQIDSGAAFGALAAKESDGASKANSGKMGQISRGELPVAFEQAAFAMKAGQVSEPVETEFGYHIIRLEKEPVVSPDTVNADILTVAGADSGTRAEAMVQKLQTGKVTSTEQALTLRTLFFSLLPTGWKDTALDGTHFRHASVTVDPVTSIPVVQIAFDSEGGSLFQELTKRNIGKPIAIFVGGELVSAPTVQSEIIGGTAIITGSSNIEEARLLSQDLNTGAIPAPIYLTGQYTVEATLGAEALQTSLFAAFVGAMLLMLYMLVAYRLLGIIANLALIVYALLNFAILKVPLFLVSGNYVVLTLAGMAGIILSLGMAVDANVLVFERLKEELRKGKVLRTAVESSFKHAWPAIRDGNISTLITCAILFLIGTSIVRGFAITLGMGVLLSMFTAITVTRWMLRKVVALPGMDKPSLYGVRTKKE